MGLNCKSQNRCIFVYFWIKTVANAVSYFYVFWLCACSSIIFLILNWLTVFQNFFVIHFWLCFFSFPHYDSTITLSDLFHWGSVRNRSFINGCKKMCNSQLNWVWSWQQGNQCDNLQWHFISYFSCGTEKRSAGKAAAVNSSPTSMKSKLVLQHSFFNATPDLDARAIWILCAHIWINKNDRPTCMNILNLNHQFYSMSI